MSANFTPGPWEIGAGKYTTYTVVATTPRGLKKAIAQVGGYGGDSRPANARLMAAAPDMWGIVETIAKLIDDGAPSSMILDENSPTMDAVRDVIAKVRGAAS